MIDKQAIIAGLICLDVTPDLSAVPEGQFQHLFQPGRLIRTGAIRCTPGGAVANTGLALHRLGVPVRLIGKIGDDLFGQALQDRLREASPHLVDDLVIDLSMPTSFTIVINPPGSDRTFLHHPGANDTLYASDLPRQILEKADLFHFGYPPLMRSIYRGEGAELVSILQRARRAGLSTSLDFTLPDPTSHAAQLDWPSILANTLPLVDLFVPSVEELLFLLDRDAYNQICTDPHQSVIDAIEPDRLEALAETVLSYGVKALLVKLGHRGLYLRTVPAERWEKSGRGLEGLDESWHDRQIWAPAFSTTVKSLTGAGDAAIAGFLASIMRGTHPEKALHMAAAVGALSVENTDAIGALEGWDEIYARVQGGWESIPLVLNAFGWLEDQAQGVWMKQSHPQNAQG
jgi:sugar/nucleoside kinase (ribokinase family)